MLLNFLTNRPYRVSKQRALDTSSVLKSTAGKPQNTWPEDDDRDDWWDAFEPDEQEPEPEPGDFWFEEAW